MSIRTPFDTYLAKYFFPKPMSLFFSFPSPPVLLSFWWEDRGREVEGLIFSFRSRGSKIEAEARFALLSASLRAEELGISGALWSLFF